jgi:hypothetical protein
MLTIHRTFKQIVWVSHGSKDGIATQNGLMTWKDFSHRVDRTPGRDIVLACKSSEIYKFIDNSAALGFTGIVEATIGGFLA